MARPIFAREDRPASRTTAACCPRAGDDGRTDLDAMHPLAEGRTARSFHPSRGDA